MSGWFLSSCIEDNKTGLNPQSLDLQFHCGSSCCPCPIPSPEAAEEVTTQSITGARLRKWMNPASSRLQPRGRTRLHTRRRGCSSSRASLQPAATAGIWGMQAPRGSRSWLPSGGRITCRVAQWQWTKGKFRPSIRKINCWGFLWLDTNPEGLHGPVPPCSEAIPPALLLEIGHSSVGREPGEM